MRPLVYRVTKSPFSFSPPLHVLSPYGYAYATETRFVHVPGSESGLWPLNVPGMIVTQGTTGTLRNWIEGVFGAIDIQDGVHEVGHSVAGVWRPGLIGDLDLRQALSVRDVEARLAEQALFILIERLNELLLFVEPSKTTLDTFSHKARELLILACTEVENSWKAYLRLAGTKSPIGREFGTRDYVRLHCALHLAEYEISLPRYDAIHPLRPFLGWDPEKSSASLPWYRAYNLTKHDRSTNFAQATLSNCLLGVAANIALFCSRFGPQKLLIGNDTLSANFNQIFRVALKDCSPVTFYVPRVSIPDQHSTGLTGLNVNEPLPWTPTPLVL